MSRFMASRDLPAEPRRLFYSNEFGLTLVSKADRWDTTLESYVSRIDTSLDPADSDFIRTKKEYFQREISIMRTIQHLPHLEVSGRVTTSCFPVYAAALFPVQREPDSGPAMRQWVSCDTLQS
jgi:hypothetical protein